MFYILDGNAAHFGIRWGSIVEETVEKWKKKVLVHWSTALDENTIPIDGRTGEYIENSSCDRGDPHSCCVDGAPVH